MFNLAAVALGGAFGSIARYYLSNSTLKHFIFFDIPFDPPLAGIKAILVITLKCFALSHNLPDSRIQVYRYLANIRELDIR